MRSHKLKLNFKFEISINLSRHILHVFQHGAILGRERAFITCKSNDQPKRRLNNGKKSVTVIAPTTTRASVRTKSKSRIKWSSGNKITGLCT